MVGCHPRHSPLPFGEQIETNVYVRHPAHIDSHDPVAWGRVCWRLRGFSAKPSVHLSRRVRVSWFSHGCEHGSAVRRPGIRAAKCEGRLSASTLAGPDFGREYGPHFGGHVRKISCATRRTSACRPPISSARFAHTRKSQNQFDPSDFADVYVCSVRASCVHIYMRPCERLCVQFRRHHA